MKVGDPGHSHIEGESETLQEPGIPGVDPNLIEVQCFPFYSILLAVGVTQVDFLSLDVEGHELKILKTIPWRKLDIKVTQLKSITDKNLKNLFMLITRNAREMKSGVLGAE